MRRPLGPGSPLRYGRDDRVLRLFRAFRSAGVTRLSLGVQSFDDAMLVRLGRVHDDAQARAALTEAAACFDTFNLDLMYALPGQTLAMLQADLDAALSTQFAYDYLREGDRSASPEVVPAVTPFSRAAEALRALRRQTSARIRTSHSAPKPPR